ncbi:MAG: GIY-YIG nuclease family protein [Bacteroidales bacterium]|nr:GIY-YIG nuclease family protein [Bacteroidales bacterium]MDD3877330.1 GIY-YIG nuclease family protein [Bacteroidales bacterium]
MKYTTYIIFSPSINKYYTGQTNDIKKRLREHNAGKSKFTAHGIPWELVYELAFESRIDAVTHEYKIKNLGAKRFLAELNQRSW